jgi:hypothetical protein
MVLKLRKGVTFHNGKTMTWLMSCTRCDAILTDDGVAGESYMSTVTEVRARMTQRCA